MKTYERGSSDHGTHMKGCDWKSPNGFGLDFVPPDDEIAYCPKCQEPVFYATAVMDLDHLRVFHVAHPCHHELEPEEADAMIKGSVQA